MLPVGTGVPPSEAVFVPAAGASNEDDGYVLTVVSDLNRDASSVPDQLPALTLTGWGEPTGSH
ncbi:carotenoid oxygenase family protein [Micromonospora sp. NPDC006431]|uniref:carotenoid oxygenase family protein n=1 Tax=Micromonospora sp. NPDC006431 TaxID=3364235 RepID=UPI0036AC8C6D